MSVAEFVSALRKLDVRLSVNGERLRVNAPKGVLTDSLRGQIAEHKQELLQFLTDYEQSSAFTPPPILRRTNSDLAPLSFAQERLWFLEQLEPRSAVYNICRAFRLRGNLNIAALEASLAEILRRHEILRSQIRIVDGRPVQFAVAVPRFEVLIIDLRSFTETECEREVRDRIKREAEWQFVFAAGLFFRAVLLQISNDQHILILITHHIVADAWSMGILTREVWPLYDAYAKGNPLDREDLPIQYADYAVWQRQWLQGDVLESQLSYWKEQLKELSVLNLPTDYLRPAKQSFRGARQSLSLPESLTKAVNELSGRERVTQFMTLVAAFQVLLYRYSGQEDVVVGSPIANRNRTEVEGLIGFFVNILVLRTDLSEKPTFKELLQRVRDVCLGAYAHQDLPFEKLVEELRPERDLSRNPLFQVMFVLQNTPRPLPQTAELSIERVDVLPATSLFDLSLYLRERDGKLIGFFEYNTDLFEPATIERMIGHFEMLLKGIVADPEQPISTLPLLTQAERHQVLVEWNNTETEYPKDVCIHELFEAQAAKTPEAIALEFEAKQLTYEELNRRANQLGHYLQRFGIGPEKLVGICMNRSIEMVIGLIGILKAGGAYVPLDPSYPRERLEFMLKDAQVSVLLTEKRLVDGREWIIEDGDPQFLRPRSGQASIFDSQMKVVCFDSHWETIALESEQNTRSEVKPDNLAYVIYTSGSTGNPKGVAIEHRNTVNLLQWAKAVYGKNELAGVLASTSICFDLSVFELFVPTTCGGKVILAGNALCLHDLAAKQEITLINTVPSVVAQLLTLSPLPKSVRVVNLAGEPLKPELVKELYTEGNVEKVYDLYGPSETTTYSTFTLRTREGATTIGRPLANTCVFILDSSLQPVPVGVGGELYIGGDGLARGYLNRPEVTSERFVPYPFSDVSAKRLYRTGDRARYRSDGNIEFLGRTDNQVKIRGYRIELGEIEVALDQHPSIKESVIVVRDRDSSGEKDLIAYFVPQELSPVATSGLRNFLRDKLPDCMVPSLFVELEELPILPNGKIDRIALQLRDDTRSELKETFAEPRTHVHELVAQIWEEVLKIDAAGIHDNFFELGGHSLLATQIISRVRAAFGKDVPLSALFDAPTIAGLAATIEKTISVSAHDLPPIIRAPRDGPLPLSMNQEHLWQLDRMIPGTHFFNMPYVYHLSGDLNVSALEKALQEIVKRHEALRTVFAETDGCPTQIIKGLSEFHLAYVDLCGESIDKVSEVSAGFISEERRGPFDLMSGPLLRTKLIHLTSDQYLLLVTIHHIIGDEWSMHIFQRELAILYGAFLKNGVSPLPDIPIQFIDYAVWERQSIQSGIFDVQLKYWRKQLAMTPHQVGFENGCKIATKELDFHTSSERIEVEEPLFLGVRKLSQEQDCTPLTVLLAALTITIHLCNSERDIRIGIVTANRASKDKALVIGNFTNTIILRTEIQPTLTARQFVRQVRDNALVAYSNDNLPFEHMAQILASEQGQDHSTKFAVQVIYTNMTGREIEFPGLTFAPFPIRSLGVGPEFMISDVDLIFRLQELSTKLTGSLTYKTGSINQSRAASIIELFKTILSLLINKTDSSLSSLLCEKAVMQIRL